MRVAMITAAALIAWFAVRRDAPFAPRPAELFDETPRAASSWTRPDTLGRGETLEAVLRRGGLKQDAVGDVLSAAPMLDPRRLRAGTEIEFLGESDSVPPTEILLKLDMTDPASSRILRLTRGDSGGWSAVEERIPWTRDTVIVRGAVRATMYDALSQLAAAIFPGRARDELVENIAAVFDHRVDWSSDLRSGDSVYALVERSRGPNDATRAGRVLAARLWVGGRRMEAVCFPEDPVRGRCLKYYDSTGRSLATAFLRAPLQFRWISSRFGNRFHPILRTWRAHQGVDYAAGSGTPVRSVGDGVVVRAVYNPGGYGNVVDVRHPNGWVTRYAHLSRFSGSARAGARVLQGDVIGYVGATGLATAPHLHFEVLVQGRHRNPSEAFARVDGTPLPAADRQQFDRTRDILLAMLAGSEGVVRAADNVP